MDVHRPDASLYVLGVQFDQPRSVTVGSLGPVDLPPGWVAYVGRSERGWTSRLNRFTNEERKPFWHIDYPVEARGRWDAVVPVVGRAEDECRLAADLVQGGEGSPLTGFGNSDCGSSCATHALAGAVDVRLLTTSLRSNGWPVHGFVRRKSDRCRWVSLTR